MGSERGDDEDRRQQPEGGQEGRVGRRQDSVIAGSRLVLEAAVHVAQTDIRDAAIDATNVSAIRITAMALASPVQPGLDLVGRLIMVSGGSRGSWGVM